MFESGMHKAINEIVREFEENLRPGPAYLQQRAAFRQFYVDTQVIGWERATPLLVRELDIIAHLYTDCKPDVTPSSETWYL